MTTSTNGRGHGRVPLPSHQAYMDEKHVRPVRIRSVAVRPGCGRREHLDDAPVFAADAVFLLFLDHPCRSSNRRKSVASMLENLKKNDKVLTTGGIYATVISVDGSHDRVVLRVDDERGVKMTFTMSSVARVLEASSDKPSEST